MPALDTAIALTRFQRRGAGTDAERRAAVWLAAQVRGGRRRVALQTFWCRPNWALAQAWHTLAAVVGSLLAVHHAFVGGAIVLGALLSVIGDWRTGHSPGRRLTREHASQNVVSRAPESAAGDPATRVRLIVTAHYDAGRTGVAHRNWLRIPTARLKRMAGAGRLTPGWLGWLVIAMGCLLVVAVLRHGGAAGTPLAVAQLIPTAALVLTLALLLELAGAPFGPAASDNGSGAAVAMALVRALDAAPPRRLDVDLVLQGAGEAGMTGLTRHLRSRRGELRSTNTIVLGVAAAGSGRPHWWISDGPLVPLRSPGRLRQLAAQAGAGGSAHAHRGRGTSPALPARMRRLPALSIGCLDHRGLAPRSHQTGDTAAMLDPAALDALLHFGLMLVDAIDADLARPAGSSEPERVPAVSAHVNDGE
jgi:peptidase M28-like protein